MASPTNSAISYKPSAVPADPKDWQRYLREEMSAISDALNALAEGHVETTYVAPAKPRDGDIRLADGVHWDPLALAGTTKYWVGYRDAAWKALA